MPCNRYLSDFIDDISIENSKKSWISRANAESYPRRFSISALLVHQRSDIAWDFSIKLK